ncbi:MAG TPA: hypothetical protein VGF99_18550 [Myxococcota bacterium]
MTMLVLMLLATTTSTTPPAAPLTLYEEIEAWNPADEARVVPVVSAPSPRDADGRALELVAPVLIGTTVAALPAVLLANVAGSAFFWGAPQLSAVAWVVAAGVLGAGPLIAVSLAGGELPAWTKWLAGGVAAAAGSVAFGASTLTALAIIRPRRDDTLRYILDNRELVALYVVPPVLGLLAAGAGGVVATTIGAHSAEASEQDHHPGERGSDQRSGVGDGDGVACSRMARISVPVSRSTTRAMRP